MNLVSIDVSDANGIIRRMLFWQDDEGNLVEVRGLNLDGSDANNVIATLSDGTEHSVGSADNPMHIVGEVSVVGRSGYIDLRGALSNRPSASTLVEGSTYWAYDTGEVFASDGSDWIPVS